MTKMLTQSEAYEQAPRLLALTLADEYSDDPEDYEGAYTVTRDGLDDIFTGLNERGPLWWEGKIEGYRVVMRENCQTRKGETREGLTVIDTGEHRIAYFGGI